MQNYNRRGQTLTWRNDSGDNVKGGDLVIIGDLAGVAVKDITAEAMGTLAMEGVYYLEKAAGAISAGQRVYIDDSGKITTDAGNHPAGVAWAPAASGDLKALVKINV